MSEAKTPTCDVCGKPATNAAVDVLRHEAPGHQWVQRSPAGLPKYGCDEHPVQSEELGVTELPHDAERETLFGNKLRDTIRAIRGED